MAWQRLAVSDQWRRRVRPILGTMLVVYAAGVYGVNYLGRFASIKLAGWGG